jgi:hypothetical protein
VIGPAAARARTHGDFAKTAVLSDALKEVLRADPRWPTLAVRHREALAQIAVNMARIVCGNSDHPGHWHHIADYAALGASEGEPEGGTR